MPSKRPMFEKPIRLYLPSPIYCLGNDKGLIRDSVEPRWLLRLANGAVVRAGSQRRSGEYLVRPGEYPEWVPVGPGHPVVAVWDFICCWTTPAGELAGDVEITDSLLARWIVGTSEKIARGEFETLLLSHWFDPGGDGLAFPYDERCRGVDRQLAERMRAFFRPLPVDYAPLPDWAQMLPVVQPPSWLETRETIPRFTETLTDAGRPW